jgi:hypothetical protein
MYWKKYLAQLEQSEKFDEALLFMQETIKENPEEVDCIIFMLYLLADLIMEPHKRMINKQGVEHYWNQEYRKLAKKYFNEGYVKFSQYTDKEKRGDFLYYVGLIAVFGAQVFDIPDEQADVMIKMAQQERPDYPLYHLGEPGNAKLAAQLLDLNSSVRKILEAKGALGRYILEINESWAHMTIQGY